LQILFDDEFEEYLFARWADYLLQLNLLDETSSRLDLFDFELLYKQKILQFYKLSKVSKKKSEGDYQKWLSEIIKKKTLH
jgi:hypothetical protein|tara:strand:- start:1817 stop:2056 length:240 start_codon:yes stop_codon:yes gene_type:complete